MIKYQERILALESLVHDKDSIIYDLQRKLDNITRVKFIFLLVKIYAMIIFLLKRI